MAYMVNRLKWHWYPRFRIITRYPPHVDLEISSACNLRCPMCYTITEKFKAVPKKMMGFDLFKKVIDEIAGHVYSIRISLRGESFLNRDIFKMIRYAKDAGIKEVASLTSLVAIKKEDIPKLVDCGLDWLTISVDGVHETYDEIRKPGKFSETLEKIQILHQTKKERGTVKPVVNCQSVFPAVQHCAEEYVRLLSPYVDKLAAMPIIDYETDTGNMVYEKNFSCPTMYQRLVVASDGRVLMCVNDEYGKHILGDIRQQTVHEVWHSKGMNALREAHKKHKGVESYEACSHCALPRATKREKIAGYLVDQYVVEATPASQQGSG